MGDTFRLRSPWAAALAEFIVKSSKKYEKFNQIDRRATAKVLMCHLCSNWRANFETDGE